MNQSLGRFSFLLVGIMVWMGCHSDPVTPTPPVYNPNDSIHYLTITGRHIQMARAGEAYGLWYRYGADSVWQLGSSFTQLYSAPADSLQRLYGYFILHGSLDSISAVQLTLDPLSGPRVPTSHIATGTLSGGRDSVRGVMAAAASFSAFGATSADVIFVSSTSDTNRAQHEFYLADQGTGGLTASLQSLPLPPIDWIYALWVTDSNFYPRHKFLYGTFASASGHDSDSLNDAYPFPGGFRTNDLDVPGGNILITLEPKFSLSSLRTSGPSGVNILSLPLPRFITNGETLAMKNVAATTVPTVAIIIKR